MITITLQPLLHRSRECMAIQFPEDAKLNKLIKKIPGTTWTKTHKCWLLPLNRDCYNRLIKTVTGIAQINNTPLRSYLQKKKIASETVPPKHISPLPKTTIITTPVARSKTNILSSVTPGKQLTQAILKVHRHNLEELAKFIRHLKLKAYSPSTIRTYRNEFLQLLQKLGHIHVSTLSPDHIKNYMLHAMEKDGISENTAHSRLNALKFYFEQVLGQEKFFWEVPRPKKPWQLPKVFSQDEVAAIINNVSNLKHKTMLMLAYSAGLRVSEVVSLRTTSIDSSRMTIFIESAKGKKDRVVILSPVLLVMLREYAREYHPPLNGYLFEGFAPDMPYSSRSLQEVLQAAKKKAGVMKRGSIHSLRHSFATHLIDKGTDVTMIQKLLGHNDLKTTLRYLHTSNKDLMRIMSPLDDLRLK